VDLLVACAAGPTGYLVGGISSALIVLPAGAGGEVPHAEIDALSRGAGGAPQPAAGAGDDQPPGAAT
jgi:hypothetical protein